jgi:hypothetical protein
MTSVVALAVYVAILSSTGIVVVVTATGLNRTPFCLMPSLAVVVLVWLAYPPAQQLSPIVSLVFWALVTLAMYHFPTPSSDASTTGSPSPTDDELLEQFFKETHT